MTITISRAILEPFERIAQEAAHVLEGPYRMTLHVHLDEFGERVSTIVFPHNPEGYDRGYSSRWRARGASGVSYDLSDFEGHDPQSLSLTLLVPAEGDPERLESSFLLPLESAAALIIPETLEGPRALLLAGVHSFTGHISRLTVKRVRTDYRGYATVAEVSLEMTRNDNT